MDRSQSNESVSNKSEDSCSTDEPAVGGSSDERDPKKSTGAIPKIKPVDQPSNFASEFASGDESTSSGVMLATPTDISPISEEVAELCSTFPHASKDADDPTILNLPEIELISITSRIVDSNERYIEKLNREIFEAVDVLEPVEAILRPAEARQHELLEQRDSVLAEGGAESADIALHCEASGSGKKGMDEHERRLRRSRVVIGLLKNELVLFQQLRFNSELLMNFLLENRPIAQDDKPRHDSSNSPSMPKFGLRPHVHGIRIPMDLLFPLLDNFITRTKDLVSNYRIKSPDCDENALKEYLELFFELQERLEALENHVRHCVQKYEYGFKIHKELAELVKQSRILHGLVVQSQFKLSRVLYKYNLRIKEKDL